MFVHKTAALIKSLEFTYVRRGSYLQVVPTNDNNVFWILRFWTLHAECRCYDVAHFRRYDLDDFGNAHYDRYQIDSDSASGITLGRVEGTRRWGHEPDPELGIPMYEM